MLAKSLYKTCLSPNQRITTKSSYPLGWEEQESTARCFFVDFIGKYAIIEVTNINKHMNKYEKWYKDITNRGQSRITNERTESHHIIPKCLGGADDKSNLTNVTLREHFICHWLLTKIHYGKERHQLLKALWMMKAENQNQTRYKTKITSRVYATLKEEYIKLQSIKVTGKGNGFYGKTHTLEARKRISEANKGRVPPQEEIEKMKLALAKRREQGIKRATYSDEYKKERSKKYSGEGNPNFGKTHSEETKAKQRAKAVGRKQSAETVQKKADAVRGSKREKKLCPHCDQLVAVNGYARWHGINCKFQ